MSTTKKNVIISRKELETHNKEGNGWVVINEDVYDLSKFYALHPVSLLEDRKLLEN